MSQSFDECNISLCTATTDADNKPVEKVSWKLTSQTARAKKATLNGSFLSSPKANKINQSMAYIQVEERNFSQFGGKSGSKFGGVTIGLGNLLYKPQQVPSLQSLSMSIAGEISEERSDQGSSRRDELGSRVDAESINSKTSEYLSLGRRSVSCTFSSSEGSSSIEVSMPAINEGYELSLTDASNKKKLYENVKRAEESFARKEAKLENQKRLAHEKQLADEVRLVEMTRETKAAYIAKNNLLSQLAIDAANAEKARNAEEIRLSESLQSVLEKLDEQRQIFQNIRLEEERNLEEEERKLAEKRKLFEEIYQMEEARLDLETRRAEERLLRMAEEACVEELSQQARLEELSRQVEDARKKADEARKLVEEEAKYIGSLTFEESISMTPSFTLPYKSQVEHTGDQFEAYTHKSLHNRHWIDKDASIFSVRGKNYFNDKKKTQSQPSLFRLMTVDLFEVENPIMTGFCSHPGGRVQHMLDMEKSNNLNVPTSHKMPPFVFCMNMVLPGPPHYHLVMYFAIDDIEKLGIQRENKQNIHQSEKKHYSSLLQKFLFGESDTIRNKILKMIPRVTEGSFLLKTAIGTKPFILGKYLDQKFVRHERYLEAIVDVSSSATTQKLLGLSSVYVSCL